MLPFSKCAASLGNAGDVGALMHLNGTLSLLLWLTQQRGGAPMAAGQVSGSVSTRRLEPKLGSERDSRGVIDQPAHLAWPAAIAVVAVPWGRQPRAAHVSLAADEPQQGLSRL